MNKIKRAVSDLSTLSVDPLLFSGKLHPIAIKKLKSIPIIVVNFNSAAQGLTE